MIEVDGLNYEVAGTAILHQVGLALEPGGITALIGPNGAGKSSLLHCMAGLNRPVAGRVRIDGLDPFTAPGEERARAVALLQQSPVVVSRLKVRDLVAFGRWPHHRGRSGARDAALVEAALAAFSLQGLAERPLETLSGGQRQRAFIAMTLAQQTAYLLLDEPLNNLDLTHAVAIMRMLRTAADTLGTRVVVVLHDINFASRWSDEIVAMAGGRVVAQGPPAQVVTPEVLRGLYGVDVHVETVRGHRVAVHYG